MANLGIPDVKDIIACTYSMHVWLLHLLPLVVGTDWSYYFTRFTLER